MTACAMASTPSASPVMNLGVNTSRTAPRKRRWLAPSVSSIDRSTMSEPRTVIASRAVGLMRGSLDHPGSPRTCRAAW